MGCVSLLELADRIKDEFPSIDVVKHIGPCEEFAAYINNVRSCRHRRVRENGVYGALPKPCHACRSIG